MAAKKDLPNNKALSLKASPGAEGEELREGYKVLGREGFVISEMENVFGENKEQPKSEEDNTSWIDALTDTHNMSKFSEE